MTRKQTIRRILRETYCRLGVSDVHGIGVFAVRDIPKGVDPFRVGGRARDWVEIKQHEFEGAPAGVRNVLTALFVADSDGLFRIPSLGTNLVDIGSYESLDAAEHAHRGRKPLRRSPQDQSWRRADGGLPHLRGGAFVEVREGVSMRVSIHYEH